MNCLWLSVVVLCQLLQQIATQYVEPPNYGWGVRTSLDDYVHRDDGVFSWFEVTSYRYEEERVTAYIINMTSQQYMDETFVNRYIWWHTMCISIPDQLEREDVGALFISSGSNNDGYPGPTDGKVKITVDFANKSHTISAVIRQVPNQPTVFTNDPSSEERTEDEAIAWSWKTFVDNYYTPNHNPDVAYRNPMTKAAKRGLDTIAEFAKTKIPTSNVQKFLVAGISKRGWTTWSIASTDRRIIAAAPNVFSLLHMEESVMAHYRAMNGAWSFALYDYYNEGLTPYLTEPVCTDRGGLFDIEDLYRYRARLTMPKLLIAATGDEFFLCQDTHYWWSNMTKPMYLQMLPNTEHGMDPYYNRTLDTIAGFWLTILRGLPFPTLTWTRSEFANSGEIILQTDIIPSRVIGFNSVTLRNDTRRDFRLFAEYPDVVPHPALWSNSSVIENLGPGVYRSIVDKVPDEWAAHMIEVHYDGPEGLNMVLTTEVNIVPDTFLVGPCKGVDCTGYLT